MKKQTKIKSIEKAIKIITFIGEQKEGVKSKDLSKKLNINLNTLYHITSTLLELEIIEKNYNSKKYFIGPKLIEISNNYYLDLSSSINLLPEKIRPALAELVKKINENIYLILVENSSPIIVEATSSTHLVRPANIYPKLSEAHATAWGKLLLSSYGPDKLDSHINKFGLEKFTNNTIITKNELEKELEKILENGYAIDAEESVEGICCIAKTLKINKDFSILITSVVIPKQRYNKKFEEQIINDLKSLIV